MNGRLTSNRSATCFSAPSSKHGFSSFEYVETTDLHPRTPYHFGTAGDWRRIYIANGFRFIDPYLAKSRRVGLPFDRHSVSMSDMKSKPLMRLIKAAQDYGLREGLFCPHHMRDGQGRLRSHFCALIWMRSEADFRAMLAEHRHRLHLITTYFFEQAATLRGLREETPESVDDESLLTSRERQILELAARGLTSEAAAESMQISALTAQTHIKNATKKLKALNKTHAVSLAIARGLIRV